MIQLRKTIGVFILSCLIGVPILYLTFSAIDSYKKKQTREYIDSGQFAKDLKESSNRNFAR